MQSVIVGGSLGALRTAAELGHMILCIPQRPSFFTPDLLSEWETMAFSLSLSGQMPLADNIASLRVEQENKRIRCFTKNSKIISFEYEELLVVDDHLVDGLPIPHPIEEREYMVFDWVNVRRGANHPYDFINDEDTRFVSRLLFYPSQRVLGERHSRKDACAISIMTEKELTNLDYSESYVFLKTRDMMKSAGIRGSRNGTQAYNGKPAYLSLQLETSSRDVIPLYKNSYPSTPSLKFINFLDNCLDFEYNRYLKDNLGTLHARR